MLSIIHIKGERQPSRESKFAINFLNYCSFYRMDKSLFSDLDSSVLCVLGGVLGQAPRTGYSEVFSTPGTGLEAGVWGAGGLASVGT